MNDVAKGKSCNVNYPEEGTSGPQVAIELTQNLIRIPSLTPIKTELVDAASYSLNYLESYLERFGAKCQRLVFEGDHDKWFYPVDNLYAEWTFGEGGKHLCFMGHTDVVAPGELSQWSEDPYSGILKNGWIYGRGATDMKGAVASFCAAITQSIEKLKDISCTISLIITTDEEWAAINGTRKVLSWLKSEGKAINAFIVGEPSSNDEFGSHIKVGRRGSLCGTLNANGVQGHAAYKELFDNPNRALSLACTILNAYEWGHNNPHFPQTNFEIIANLSGDFGATAIIPDKAEALWNIRFTPQYTPQTLVQTLEKLLSFPPDWAEQHPDFYRLKNVKIDANIDTASLSYYSKPAQLADIAVQTVEQVTNKKPELDGTGGTTDGRFVQQFFPKAEIIELGLPEKGGKSADKQLKDYGKRGGMHQIDERCRIKDIESLFLCYQEIMHKFARLS